MRIIEAEVIEESVPVPGPIEAAQAKQSK
jgi:hypothetical protein